MSLHLPVSAFVKWEYKCLPAPGRGSGLPEGRYHPRVKQSKKKKILTGFPVSKTGMTAFLSA